MARVAAAIALTAIRAAAHEGEPLEPHDLPTAWVLDPWILIPLALSGWLYWRGSRPLWADKPGRGIRRWEARAFWAGWAALAVALVSPLHALGEALFSAHMAQHELMMVVAAPLVVLGRPLVPFLWGLPLSWRRRAGRLGQYGWFQAGWRALSHPLSAWSIHAVAVWIWHVPGLYEATVENDLIHTFQHVSFLGSALLFWWALIHGREAGMGHGAAIVYVFTTALHGGALGAILTFAPTTWYPIYENTTWAWGLTALEDQQLAGLIMWIPAGLLYAVAALALAVSLMRESEASLIRREAEARTRHAEG
ncbi:MAG: cytochrome c oxidase assembly protein [Bryobacteraceae bacterium]|nr:cytochrome c oxidase assembly protein [Bryobacteraceae bacterium]